MAKTYLVTGASSGIGAEFARELASQGFDLVLVARRLERLDELGQELHAKYNVKVTNFRADLANRIVVDELIANIKTKNIKIYGLINNAGLSIASLFLQTEYKKQIDFLELCIITPTTLINAFLPEMVKAGEGRIINVSSMVAFSNGAAGHTLYPAAKSYVLKMTRSIAAEIKGTGVKITALCPGATESEFQTVNGVAAKIGKDNFLKPMPTSKVVEEALKANEAGKEQVITGFANKFAVAMMKFMPEFILTPIIRNAAKKYSV